jgi:hypothetical protein
MTAARVQVTAPDTRQITQRRKLWGLAFMALPVTLFVAFAVGEGIGREEGWWGHLLQLAVAVLLAVGAWVRPRIGGPALILVGTLFVGWMLVADGALAGMPTRLLIVPVPLIVAGVFFALAGRATTRPPLHR